MWGHLPHMTLSLLLHPYASPEGTILTYQMVCAVHGLRHQVNNSRGPSRPGPSHKHFGVSHALSYQEQQSDTNERHQEFGSAYLYIIWGRGVAGVPILAGAPIDHQGIWFLTRWYVPGYVLKYVPRYIPSSQEPNSPVRTRVSDRPGPLPKSVPTPNHCTPGPRPKFAQNRPGPGLQWNFLKILHLIIFFSLNK